MKYCYNDYWTLTFGCLGNASVSSTNASQWCVQNKQEDSANLDIVKIQILFLNNKYTDLFPLFKHAQMASFHNHPQGKIQSCGTGKGGFS